MQLYSQINFNIFYEVLILRESCQKNLIHYRRKYVIMIMC